MMMKWYICWVDMYDDDDWKEKYGGNMYLDPFGVNFLVPSAADEQVLFGIPMVCEVCSQLAVFGHHPQSSEKKCNSSSSSSSR